MDACLEEFRLTPKMGGEALSRTFEEQLKQQIGESFHEDFKKQNETKASHFKTLLAVSAAVASGAFVAGTVVAGTIVSGGVATVAGITTWAMGRLLPYFR